jgi:hypothetical protein
MLKLAERFLESTAFSHRQAFDERNYQVVVVEEV